MSLIRTPWLLMPAALSHALAPKFLPPLSTIAEGAGLISPADLSWRSFRWRDLEFRNPVGIAGGVDKNGVLIKAFWKLGVGFIEVGTVTPRAQKPNQGKLIDRDDRNKALWNYLGFPNRGAGEIVMKLEALGSIKQTPVFVNIGKNRDTPNERAVQDYLLTLEAVAFHADGIVVNVSSPNTVGLRNLTSSQFLSTLLEKLTARVQFLRANLKKSLPLLLKLSPDLEDDDLAGIIRTSLSCGVDGFILTNTTTHRDTKLSFPSHGGVSGEPLKARSVELLQKTIELLGSSRKDKLVVSVGGILSPEEVLTRLDLGANLVQVYTALVYYGPFFFRDCARVFRSSRAEAMV